MIDNRISILKRIGSLVESPSLYGHLTAMENLEVYRRIYGVAKERTDSVLKIVELDNTGNKTVRKFSLGMKQRLAIALALLPEHELLILDEPTNGLDPNGIIELRKLVRKLNETYGITILISSHILAEVEKMVTHVGIISQGRMLFQGSLQELQFLEKGHSKLKLNTSDNEAAFRLLKDYAPEMKQENIIVSYVDNKDIVTIGRLLHENNVDVYLLHPNENNLEQLFIDLTNTTV
jgi:ABC-2 type transport system ATP-binding protein